jgi:methyl-accepting chemotaxis protein
MRVGRKLFVAFACVLVAIVTMGAVVLVQLQAINSAQAQRSNANELGRLTENAKLYTAKQENSMRGFLVSGDEYYIARANAHRASFKEQIAKVREIGDDEMKTAADATERAADEWFDKVVVAGHALAKTPATRGQAVFMVGRNGSADRFMSIVEDDIAKLEELQADDIALAREQYDRASAIALWSLIIGMSAAALISLIVGLILTKALGGPILNMIRHMDRIRSGDLTVEVPCALRKDEFGQMGVAVLAFRDAAIEKNRVEAQATADREAAEAERARNLSLTEKAQLEQANVV